VLSQGYEPIKVISWQRAITLLFQGKIEVLREYEGCDIRSSTVVIKMPAVVRILQAFRRNKKNIKFSRVNIYARDNFRCQYCSTKMSMSDLTYDHVKPRAQGGLTEWTNIVSACNSCNAKKGNRTPEAAGMKLKCLPIKPARASAMTLRISSASAPEAWRDFCYWTDPLEEG